MNEYNQLNKIRFAKVGITKLDQSDFSHLVALHAYLFDKGAEFTIDNTSGAEPVSHKAFILRQFDTITRFTPTNVRFEGRTDTDFGTPPEGLTVTLKGYNASDEEVFSQTIDITESMMYQVVDATNPSDVGDGGYWIVILTVPAGAKVTARVAVHFQITKY